MCFNFLPSTRNSARGSFSTLFYTFYIGTHSKNHIPYCNHISSVHCCSDSLEGHIFPARYIYTKTTATDFLSLSRWNIIDLSQRRPYIIYVTHTPRERAGALCLCAQHARSRLCQLGERIIYGFLRLATGEKRKREREAIPNEPARRVKGCMHETGNVSILYTRNVYPARTFVVYYLVRRVGARRFW